MRLKDKVIILTGASSGIGRATALKLSSEGGKVVAVARRLEKLEELQKEATGEIFPIAGDVSEDEDIKRVVEETVKKYGKIDILVNNAGILDNYLSADNMEDEIWDKVLDVNITGPMKMIREVMPYMLDNKAGNIINTASVGGLFGGRGGMAYVASKHAIVGMTKHIGVMYHDKNIRCNAVAPGSIKTEIGTKVTNPNHQVLDKLMNNVKTFPVLGEGEQIANAILFLASDESSFVNGTVLVADGGWTAF